MNKRNTKLARKKLRFYNTLTKSVQSFTPILQNEVGLYTCGPTVYGRAHVGNLRAYVFADTLKRVLLRAGYNVKHVMNITDVGELTSGDDGTDKMQVGARRENMTVWEVAEKYTRLFTNDCEKLNIIPPTILCKATDHIQEQIELIQKLEKKGYAYIINDGVYFDTSKLNDYGKLARLDIEGLKAGLRIEMGDKKNKTDFALWKFSKAGTKRDMEWESPWGKGFPGWHIECSAMSMKYLGEQFDIHTGGIDHIPVHHTNEIAQSEVATGCSPFVKYWLHLDFLTTSDRKMSKSVGNIKDLDALRKDGIEASAFRYLCLTAKYRHGLNASKNDLKSARESYEKLKSRIQKILLISKKEQKNSKQKRLSKLGANYRKQFDAALSDDLNTPVALATLWIMLKDESLPVKDKKILIYNFDEALGLGVKDIIAQIKEVKIPHSIISIAEKRQKYREKGNWKQSDLYRNKLDEMGYNVEDMKDGFAISLHKK